MLPFVEGRAFSVVVAVAVAFALALAGPVGTAAAAAAAAAAAPTPSPSFVFPTRYSARTQGWVRDPYTGGQKAGNLGFLYVDYDAGAMRVDELWEVAQLFDSPLFTGMGIAGSDTHLAAGGVGGAGYLYFRNNTGSFCLPSQSPLQPQDMFASAFSHVERWGDRSVNVFNASISTYGFSVLYTDADGGAPLASYSRYELAPGFVLDFSLDYLAFTAMGAPFADPTLFAIPTACIGE